MKTKNSKLNRKRSQSEAQTKLDPNKSVSSKLTPKVKKRLYPKYPQDTNRKQIHSTGTGE